MALTAALSGTTAVDCRLSAISMAIYITINLGSHTKEDGYPCFMPKSRLLSWRLDDCHPPVCIKVYPALRLALFSLHGIFLQEL